MANGKGTKEQTTIYKHIHKTKDRLRQTLLRTGGERRYSDG